MGIQQYAKRVHYIYYLNSWRPICIIKGKLGHRSQAKIGYQPPAPHNSTIQYFYDQWGLLNVVKETLNILINFGKNIYLYLFI